MACKIVFVPQVSLQCGAGEWRYGRRTGWGPASPSWLSPRLSAQPWTAALFISSCLGGGLLVFHGQEMRQLTIRGLSSKGKEG